MKDSIGNELPKPPAPKSRPLTCDQVDEAKAVAKKEVLKRVKTLEQAKEYYKKWIKVELKNGGYKQETVDFWEEVCRQVDSVCIE